MGMAASGGMCLTSINISPGGMNSPFHQRYLMSVLPDAEVIVFGHTHVPVCESRGNQLFFNPGSLSGSQGFEPVYGILEINSVRGGQRQT